MSTQRLGFRGTEDLGGGLKALFQVESTMTAGGAASNGFGSRPTFVGLAGNFGTVLLGRQDTPLLKTTAAQLAGGSNNLVGQAIYSNFGLGFDGTAVTAAQTTAAGYGRMATDTTTDKAINYISPTIAGFTAEVQVGQSDTKDDTGTAPAFSKTDDTGFSLRYVAGPLTVSGANHTKEFTTSVASSATVFPGKTKTNYIGATYDLVAAKVSLQHATSKNDTTVASVFDNKVTQLGVQVPVTTAINLFGSVGMGTRTLETVDEYKQTSMQLGATYSLSKRTMLYSVYGQQELKGDNTATAGEKLKETQFALGVRHTF